MSLNLSTDDGRQNKTTNRYTATEEKKPMLKHNTAKKNKRNLSFFLDGLQMNVRTMSVKETKFYSQKEEEEKFRKMGKKFIYCCLEPSGAGN